MKSGFQNKYVAECFRNGKKIWEETVYNMVVNEGLDHVLESYFKGSGYNGIHYLGLKTAGSVTAADTLAKVGAGTTNWDEFEKYTGNRIQIQLGAVSGQKVSNANNRATFAISGVTNPVGEAVHGIMVATVNTGTSGILFGAVDFAAARTVLDGDSIVVTVEFTQANL
ncbi:hypothetical protein PVS_15 [Vibrio phage vB_VspS_VS-ABTNL-3]|nr:hypothetical protein PVS_15 [Vibrio phage vB_VspS_VS-ABTNL-3]